MEFVSNSNVLMPIVLTAKRGRIFLTMICLSIGNDFVVTLSGGDLEHIGAVAISRSCANDLSTAEAHNIITNTIIIPGHKEASLAKSISSLITASLNVVVCVICGIHLEQILKYELKDVMDMSEEMTKKLIARLTMY